ncbi:MAG: diguanylate cyclase [Candidatus Omnitrophica bacterium]|nr:diguanylate cyclase [Candidatus Omnitrophota bacterium]
MIKPKAHTEDRVVSKKESKEGFKSSFKTWIRVVAFIVAAVFLPEQVAQAVEYDWRVLWHKPAIGLPSNNAFSPDYLKNVQNINVPQAVRSILKDIANKPIISIKISDNLTIELDKPLKMSNQRIDELFNWLVGKPCGSKALYDLLMYQGLSPQGTVPDSLEQDIAVFALTVDILNDVLKPEGNPKVIKNSLYALAKASEFFGLKLYPVKIDSLQETTPAPFIAHLNGDHYVLITKISGDKIYFLDEHKEEFLPLEKFLQDFSGYALVQGLSPKGTVPLNDAEAKKILGARSNKKGYADISSLFEEPSSSDLLLGAGITIAACAAASYLGPAMSGGTATWNTGSAVASFGQGMFYSQIGQAATNIGVRNLGMNATTAGIFGTATIGALTGGTSAYAQGATGFSGIGQGALNGALLGAAKAGASVFAYDMLKDTSFFKNNPYIGRQFANLAGSAIGYTAFMGTMGALSGTALDTGYKMKVYAADGQSYKWESPQTLSQGVGMALDSMKGSLVQQGVGLAVEYAASEGWLGGTLQKHPGYSRLLGEPLGGFAGANAGSLTTYQSVMNGLLSGGVSIGLTALGGNYDEITGKNSLGMTRMQMSTLNWAGTALAYAGTGALIADTDKASIFKTAFVKRLEGLSTNYLTFGGTSPLSTGGGRGWSEVQYIEKISQLAGISDFKANADYAMKKAGYTDWNKFVEDGRLSSLMPSISYSLVNYAQSSLHYAAVNNLVDTVGYSKTAADLFGIPHSKIIEQEFNNEKHAWLAPIQPNKTGPIVGENYFSGLKGSDIRIRMEDGETVLLSLRAGLRDPLNTKVKEGDNELLFSKEQISLAGIKDKRKDGMGEIKIVGERSDFLQGALEEISANAEGDLAIFAKQDISKTDYYKGSYTFQYRKDEPTILDVYTSGKVTQKDYWFNDEKQVNVGRMYVYADNPIKAKENKDYLDYAAFLSRADGKYPVDALGYRKLSNGQIEVTAVSLGEGKNKAASSPLPKTMGDLLSGLNKTGESRVGAKVLFKKDDTGVTVEGKITRIQEKTLPPQNSTLPDFTPQKVIEVTIYTGKEYVSVTADQGQDIPFTVIKKEETGVTSKNLPSAVELSLKGSGAITGEKVNLDGLKEIKISLALNPNTLFESSTRGIPGMEAAWSRQLSFIGKAEDGQLVVSTPSIGIQAYKQLSEQMHQKVFEKAKEDLSPKDAINKNLEVKLTAVDKEGETVSLAVKGDYALNYYPNNNQVQEEWKQYGGRPEGLTPDLLTTYRIPSDIEDFSLPVVFFKVKELSSKTGKILTEDMGLADAQAIAAKNPAEARKFLRIETIQGSVIEPAAQERVELWKSIGPTLKESAGEVTREGDTLINLANLFASQYAVIKAKNDGDIRRQDTIIQKDEKGNAQVTSVDLRYAGQELLLWKDGLIGRSQDTADEATNILAPKFKEGSRLAVESFDQAGKSVGNPLIAYTSDLNEASTFIRSGIKSTDLNREKIENFLKKENSLITFNDAQVNEVLGTYGKSGRIVDAIVEVASKTKPGLEENVKKGDIRAQVIQELKNQLATEYTTIFDFENESTPYWAVTPKAATKGTQDSAKVKDSANPPVSGTIFITQSGGSVKRLSDAFNEYSGRIQISQTDLQPQVFSPGAHWALPVDKEGTVKDETKFMFDKASWLSAKGTQGGFTIGLDNLPYGWADKTVSRIEKQDIRWGVNASASLEQFMASVSRSLASKLNSLGQAGGVEKLREAIGEELTFKDRDGKTIDIKFNEGELEKCFDGTRLNKTALSVLLFAKANQAKVDFKELKIEGLGTSVIEKDFLWGVNGLKETYGEFGNTGKLSNAKIKLHAIVVGQDDKKTEIKSPALLKDMEVSFLDEKGRISASTKSPVVYFSTPIGEGDSPADRNDSTLMLSQLAEGAHGFTIFTPVAGENGKVEALDLGIKAISPQQLSGTIGILDLTKVHLAGRYIVGEGGAYFNDSNIFGKWKPGAKINYVRTENGWRPDYGKQDIAGLVKTVLNMPVLATQNKQAVGDQAIGDKESSQVYFLELLKEGAVLDYKYNEKAGQGSFVPASKEFDSNFAVLTQAFYKHDGDWKEAEVITKPRWNEKLGSFVVSIDTKGQEIIFYNRNPLNQQSDENGAKKKQVNFDKTRKNVNTKDYQTEATSEERIEQIRDKNDKLLGTLDEGYGKIGFSMNMAGDLSSIVGLPGTHLTVKNSAEDQLILEGENSKGGKTELKLWNNKDFDYYVDEKYGVFAKDANFSEKGVINSDTVSGRFNRYGQKTYMVNGEEAMVVIENGKNKLVSKRVFIENNIEKPLRELEELNKTRKDQSLGGLLEKTRESLGKGDLEGASKFLNRAVITEQLGTLSPDKQKEISKKFGLTVKGDKIEVSDKTDFNGLGKMLERIKLTALFDILSTEAEASISKDPALKAYFNNGRLDREKFINTKSDAATKALVSKVQKTLIQENGLDAASQLVIVNGRYYLRDNKNKELLDLKTNMKYKINEDGTVSGTTTINGGDIRMKDGKPWIENINGANIAVTTKGMYLLLGPGENPVRLYFDRDTNVFGGKLRLVINEPDKDGLISYGLSFEYKGVSYRPKNLYFSDKGKAVVLVLAPAAREFTFEEASVGIMTTTMVQDTEALILDLRAGSPKPLTASYTENVSFANGITQRRTIDNKGIEKVILMTPEGKFERMTAIAQGIYSYRSNETDKKEQWRYYNNSGAEVPVKDISKALVDTALTSVGQMKENQQARVDPRKFLDSLIDGINRDIDFAVIDSNTGKVEQLKLDALSEKPEALAQAVNELCLRRRYGVATLEQFYKELQQIVYNPSYGISNRYIFSRIVDDAWTYREIGGYGTGTALTIGGTIGAYMTGGLSLKATASGLAILGTTAALSSAAFYYGATGEFIGAKAMAEDAALGMFPGLGGLGRTLKTFRQVATLSKVVELASVGKYGAMLNSALYNTNNAIYGINGEVAPLSQKVIAAGYSLAPGVLNAGSRAARYFALTDTAGVAIGTGLYSAATLGTSEITARLSGTSLDWGDRAFIAGTSLIPGAARLGALNTSSSNFLFATLRSPATQFWANYNLGLGYTNAIALNQNVDLTTLAKTAGYSLLLTYSMLGGAQGISKGLTTLRNVPAFSQNLSPAKSLIFSTATGAGVGIVANRAVTGEWFGDSWGWYAAGGALAGAGAYGTGRALSSALTPALKDFKFGFNSGLNGQYTSGLGGTSESMGVRAGLAVKKVGDFAARDLSTKAVFVASTATGTGVGIVANRAVTGEWFGDNWGWYAAGGALAGAGTYASAKGASRLMQTETGQKWLAGLDRAKYRTQETIRSTSSALNDLAKPAVTGFKTEMAGYKKILSQSVSATGEVIGINQPMTFLAGSTAGAIIDYTAGDKRANLKPAAAGALGRILINPGRGILSAASGAANYWRIDNNLGSNLDKIKATERFVLNKAMRDNIGGIPSGMLSFAFYTADSYMQAYSESYTVRAITHTALHPLQVIKDIFTSIDLTTKTINSLSSGIPKDKWVEVGMFLGGMIGASKGYSNLGSRLATEAKASSFTSFMANTHTSAASLVYLNAAFTFLPLITDGGAGDPQAWFKQLYYGAYNMDQSAQGAMTMALAWNVLRAGLGRLRQTGAGQAVDKLVNNHLEHATPAVKYGLPLAMTVGGAELYALNKDKQDDLQANYLAHTGLVIAGIGAMLLANKIEKSSAYRWLREEGKQMPQPNALGLEAAEKTTAKTRTEKIFGTHSSRLYGKEWVKTELKYNIRWGGIGAIAGLVGAASSGKIKDWHDRIEYLVLGAIGGMAILRNLPALVKTGARVGVKGTEITGAGALTYGAKKMTFDPLAGWIEGELGYRNDFNFTRATTPHLFRAGDTQDDLVYALSMGVVGLGIAKVSTTAIKAYREKGAAGLEKPEGVINKGFLTKAEQHLMRSGQDLEPFLQSWSKDWGKNVLSSVGTMAVGYGLYNWGKEGEARNKDLSTLWKYAGVAMVGMGLLKTVGILGGDLNLRAIANLRGKNQAIAGAMATAAGAGLFLWGSSDDLKDAQLAGLDLGKIIQVSGGALAAVGALNMFAGVRGMRLQGKNLEAAVNNSALSRYAGNSLATAKGIIWDFGARGTTVNLFTVIAPLFGVIAATSWFTQKYISSSSYSKLEKTILDYTAGAFLNNDIKKGPLSINTYSDIVGGKGEKWAEAKGLWAKLSILGLLADRAYTASLFGTDANAKVKGDFKSMADAVSKLGSSGRIWNALDKSNVSFSAALALLYPVAEPFFSNIKPGNFGYKFQAVGKAMEDVFGGAAIAGISPRAAAQASSPLRILNMITTGTIEETVTEQAIQMILNITPLGPVLGPQAVEVIQEIASPFGNAHMNYIPSRAMAKNYVNGNLQRVQGLIDKVDAKLAKPDANTDILNHQLGRLNTTKRFYENIAGNLDLANGSAEGVIGAMLPLLQSKINSLGSVGLAAIRNNLGAMDAVEFKAKGLYSLVNQDTKDIVTAQASSDGKTVDVDAAQNLNFNIDASGRLSIRPNVVGHYNIGGGAHELVHLFVDKNRSNEKIAPLVRQIQSSLGYKTVGSVPLEISEWGPNEMLTQYFSMLFLAKYIANHKLDYSTDSSASSIQDLVERTLNRRFDDLGQAMASVNAMAQPDLLAPKVASDDFMAHVIDFVQWKNGNRVEVNYEAKVGQLKSMLQEKGIHLEQAGSAEFKKAGIYLNADGNTTEAGQGGDITVQINRDVQDKGAAYEAYVLYHETAQALREQIGNQDTVLKEFGSVREQFQKTQDKKAVQALDDFMDYLKTYDSVLKDYVVGLVEAGKEAKVSLEDLTSIKARIQASFHYDNEDNAAVISGLDKLISGLQEGGQEVTVADIRKLARQSVNPEYHRAIEFWGHTAPLLYTPELAKSIIGKNKALKRLADSIQKYPLLADFLRKQNEALGMPKIATSSPARDAGIKSRILAAALAALTAGTTAKSSSPVDSSSPAERTQPMALPVAAATAAQVALGSLVNTNFTQQVIVPGSSPVIPAGVTLSALLPNTPFAKNLIIAGYNSDTAPPAGAIAHNFISNVVPASSSVIEKLTGSQIVSPEETSGSTRVNSKTANSGVFVPTESSSPAINKDKLIELTELLLKEAPRLTGQIKSRGRQNIDRLAQKRIAVFAAKHGVTAEKAGEIIDYLAAYEEMLGELKTIQDDNKKQIRLNGESKEVDISIEDLFSRPEIQKVVNRINDRDLGDMNEERIRKIFDIAEEVLAVLITTVPEAEELFNKKFAEQFTDTYIKEAITDIGKRMERMEDNQKTQGKAIETQGKAIETQGKAIETQGKAIETQGKAIKGIDTRLGEVQRAQEQFRADVNARFIVIEAAQVEVNEIIVAINNCIAGALRNFKVKQGVWRIREEYKRLGKKFTILEVKRIINNVAAQLDLLTERVRIFGASEKEIADLPENIRKDSIVLISEGDKLHAVPIKAMVLKKDEKEDYYFYAQENNVQGGTVLNNRRIYLSELVRLNGKIVIISYEEYKDSFKYEFSDQEIAQLKGEVEGTGIGGGAGTGQGGAGAGAGAGGSPLGGGNAGAGTDDDKYDTAGSPMLDTHDIKPYNIPEVNMTIDPASYRATADLAPPVAALALNPAINTLTEELFVIEKGDKAYAGKTLEEAYDKAYGLETEEKPVRKASIFSWVNEHPKAVSLALAGLAFGLVYVGGPLLNNIGNAWAADLQTEPVAPQTVDSFAVKKGDTLWKHFRADWKKAYDANPQIHGRLGEKIGPQYPDTKQIVIIYPNEKIKKPAVGPVQKAEEKVTAKPETKLKPEETLAQPPAGQEVISKEDAVKGKSVISHIKEFFNNNKATVSFALGLIITGILVRVFWPKITKLWNSYRETAAKKARESAAREEQERLAKEAEAKKAVEERARLEREAAERLVAENAKKAAEEKAKEIKDYLGYSESGYEVTAKEEVYPEATTGNQEGQILADKEPSSIKDNIALGDRYYSEGRYSEALRAYQIAEEALLNLKSGFDRIQLNTENCCEEELKANGATKNEINKLNGKLVRVEVMVSKCYSKLGDQKKAVEVLNSAKLINPTVFKQILAQEEATSSPLNQIPVVPAAVTIVRNATITSASLNRLAAVIAYVRSLKNNRADLERVFSALETKATATGRNIHNILAPPSLRAAASVGSSPVEVYSNTNGGGQNEKLTAGIRRGIKDVRDAILNRGISGKTLKSGPGKPGRPWYLGADCYARIKAFLQENRLHSLSERVILLIRAPPYLLLYRANTVVIAAVRNSLLPVLSNTKSITNNLINLTLTKLLTLSVAGVLAAYVVVWVAQEPSSREMTPLVATLTTIIIGGALCVLSMSMKSESTTSLTLPRTGLRLLQPARMTATLGSFLSMILPVPSTLVMDVQIAGRKLSGLIASLLGQRSATQGAMGSRSTKSTQNTTNLAWAGLNVPALAGAVSSSPVSNIEKTIGRFIILPLLVIGILWGGYRLVDFTFGKTSSLVHEWALSQKQNLGYKAYNLLTGKEIPFDEIAVTNTLVILGKGAKVSSDDIYYGRCIYFIFIDNGGKAVAVLHAPGSKDLVECLADTMENAKGLLEKNGVKVYGAIAITGYVTRENERAIAMLPKNLKLFTKETGQHTTEVIVYADGKNISVIGLGPIYQGPISGFIQQPSSSPVEVTRREALKLLLGILVIASQASGIIGCANKSKDIAPEELLAKLKSVVPEGIIKKAAQAWGVEPELLAAIVMEEVEYTQNLNLASYILKEYIQPTFIKFGINGTFGIARTALPDTLNDTFWKNIQTYGESLKIRTQGKRSFEELMEVVKVARERRNLKSVRSAETALLYDVFSVPEFNVFISAYWISIKLRLNGSNRALSKEEKAIMRYKGIVNAGQRLERTKFFYYWLKEKQVLATSSSPVGAYVTTHATSSPVEEAAVEAIKNLESPEITDRRRAFKTMTDNPWLIEEWLTVECIEALVKVIQDDENAEVTRGNKLMKKYNTHEQEGINWYHVKHSAIYLLATYLLEPIAIEKLGLEKFIYLLSVIEGECGAKSRAPCVADLSKRLVSRINEKYGFLGSSSPVGAYVTTSLKEVRISEQISKEITAYLNGVKERLESDFNNAQYSALQKDVLKLVEEVRGRWLEKGADEETYKILSFTFAKGGVHKEIDVANKGAALIGRIDLLSLGIKPDKQHIEIERIFKEVRRVIRDISEIVAYPGPIPVARLGGGEAGIYYEALDPVFIAEKILKESITASSPVKTIAELEAEIEALKAENAALRRINRIDPLTKLHNRRDFDDVLKGMMKNADRNPGRRLLFVLIDIDFFGIVNKIFGHDAGDVVLKSFARTIKNKIRPAVDYVARYGGEEFALLLNGVDAETAKARIIGRCAEAVKKLELPELEVSLEAGVLKNKIANVAGADRTKMHFAVIHQLFTQGLIDETGKDKLSRLPLEELPYQELKKWGITFSAGVALYQKGMSGAELLRRADKEALSKAKINRNSIEIFAENKAVSSPVKNLKEDLKSDSRFIRIRAINNIRDKNLVSAFVDDLLALIQESEEKDRYNLIYKEGREWYHTKMFAIQALAQLDVRQVEPKKLGEILRVINGPYGLMSEAGCVRVMAKGAAQLLAEARKGVSSPIRGMEFRRILYATR